MTPDARSSRAASIRQRLINAATATGRPFDLLAQRYAVERLLLRLQHSPHADQFILKGAMVFLTWGIDLPRPTRDLDLMGFITPDAARLTLTFREVIATQVDEDGLDFPAESVTATHIMEQDHYSGIRVRLNALLGTMGIPVQIDVGTGDALHPLPQPVAFPSILGLTEPVLRAYARELVIAEKFEAMVSLGEANSRMKDFFDIWFLASSFSIDSPLLAEALVRTFDRRKTPLPSIRPLPLTAGFLSNPGKVTQWKAFLNKARLATMAPSLPEAGEVIWRLLEPCLKRRS